MARSILDKVTITGADDSVRPRDIYALAKEFPFSEWGLLASISNQGRPRFPSLQWITEFLGLMDDETNLSLHICGSWVRGLLRGSRFETTFSLDRFQRIQLNFHGEDTPCDPPAFAYTLHGIGNKQFIFQIDGRKGESHLRDLIQEPSACDINVAPLFDASGGAGIVPDEWPTKDFGFGGEFASGYAGGLGPDNLAVQIPLIRLAVQTPTFWIDAETKIRTNERFDLAKARKFLEFAGEFI